MEAVDEYLRRVAAVDLLSLEEEKAAVEAVQQKGINCEEMTKLEDANSRFIVALLLQHKATERSFWELVEAGKKGMRKAALQYRPETGEYFYRFAVPFIREEMQKQKDE